MTRVEFYVLANDQETSRLELACKLAEKAVKQNEKVYIHAETDDKASAIGDKLWQFREDSFIPHRRITESTEMAPSENGSPVHEATAAIDHVLEPVDIGSGAAPGQDRTLLINLGSEVPPFFSRFKRTLEIVNQEEATRALGRERYTFYRQRGYPLKHHNL